MTARVGRTEDALARLLALAPSVRPAVQWRSSELSYAELSSAVLELAEILEEMGAPRANVLVVGPLCPAYVVSLLACLLCGAVPVPVDAGLTPERYAWTERAARPAAVLTSDVSTVMQYWGETVAEVLLDAATGRAVLTAPGVPGMPVTRRYPGAEAGYLIPTSGSTGAPKAIVGSRTGLYDFLSWFIGEFALTEADSCAAATRANFDPSLRELLAVLAVGGRLCLPEVDAQSDLRSLAGHIAGSRATMAFLVPSLARRVAEVLDSTGSRLDDLRLGFFAGEVLPAKVVGQWAELAPQAEFVNLYGMTEGTLAQLYRRGIRSAEVGSVRGVPVGQPRPGVSVAVDRPDAEGRGAVLISSAAPALGILLEGEGPSGTFHVEPVPVPLPTGDVGSWTERGELLIEGRIGDDLKVHGKRVSFHGFVEEVERLPEVDQCVVVDRQGPQAFIAVPGLTEEGMERLRARVLALATALGLPRPTVWFRSTFPLLRSGKVDRVALAAAVEEPSGADRDCGPADGRSDVAAVLFGLLGLDPGHSASTALVDAGVSSLDVMGLVAGIERRFGVELSVQDCFGFRDVGELARAVELRSATPAPSRIREAGTAPHHGRADGLPLSTRQLAYMATCMADGNANWCNLSREIQVDRLLVPAEVSAAMNELLARHDALRLALTADWSRQTCAEADRLHCPIDFHSTCAEEADGQRGHRERVLAARTEAVSLAIDPTIAPTVRVAAIPSRGTTSVVLVAHHLFVDGLSMDLLADELRSLLLGRPLGDETSADDYRGYCLRTQRLTANAPTATEARDAKYWRELLRGAEQIRLPETADEDARDGWLLSRPFGVVASRAAHRIAASEGLSVFVVVLAAFEQTVSAFYALDPLSLVVPVQLREGAGQSIAGMFTSQLVVRGVRSDSGPLPLADRAREFSRQLERGSVAGSWEFDQRVEELGLTDSDSFPISTVLFNQHPKRRGMRVRDLGSWEPRPLGRTLRYQLQGELQVSGTEMALTYYYRLGIVMDGIDVIDRIHEQVCVALAAAAERIRHAG